MIKVLVCHRPDGLEVVPKLKLSLDSVCHRPDGLEVSEASNPLIE